MRSAALGLILVGALASCGNDKQYQHPQLDGGRRDMMVDAPAYQLPDALKNWDIQLRGPLDLTVPRDVMILDLFDVVPSQQMMGDVSVPAGAHPTAIADAQAMGARVLCKVGVGAIRLSDPDASRFAGFEAAPPDRPDPPEPDSVIGWTTGSIDADERYLDLNQSETWLPRIDARIALAKTIGCDGVVAWRANFGGADTGWSNDGAEPLALQNALFARLAERAHAAPAVSVGVQTITGLFLDGLEATHDFLLVERCGEFRECEVYRPFARATGQRPVFALEYENDIDGNPNTLSSVCSDHAPSDIINGLLKDDMLTGTVRMECP